MRMHLPRVSLQNVFFVNLQISLQCLGNNLDADIQGFTNDKYHIQLIFGLLLVDGWLNVFGRALLHIAPRSCGTITRNCTLSCRG